ncbi:taste receptor type 2 member 117 [Phodopus roborovskii]|uniref:Taste receptor type 2 n=1 Tax=Phodopus roborovskii TaxID=109678 RepID=A0AAV0A9Y1_PHORO|nr:taste receptor type 2 member 117 [Phodopus roborovskii]CAH7426403.1 Tas2r117 [Phodopus roborovskii]
MEHFWQTICDIFQNTLMFILTTELIIGNLGNGFLALVNCLSWVKRKKISFVNQILTALAASRICLLWLLYTASLISFLNPDLMMTARVTKVLSNLWIIGHHFSIWLATCLGIFYFLKIANFSNSLFLYLKWRVKEMVSVILLVSLVPLFLHILLVNLHINIWINESQRNVSYHFRYHKPAEFYRHMLSLHTLFLSVPFGVYLSSFLLLIFSLWTHHKKMQQHVQGCRDAGTMAHLRALQTVIAFLLLYTTFFLSIFVQIWKYELLEKNIFILFCQVFALAFPSVHSCVLILGDMKLRQTSLSVLWWVICRPNKCGDLRSLKHWRSCRKF